MAELNVLITKLHAAYPNMAIALCYHPDADPGDGSGWCVEVVDVGRWYGALDEALQRAVGAADAHR